MSSRLLVREMAKQRKEQMKKKKQRDKELKDLLKGSQKLKREDDDSSDSGEEPVYDDNSDDELEDITDNCSKCGLTTRQEVRIQCRLCDKWCHANCVTQMDLSKKLQEDLDAKGIQFFCDRLEQISAV